MKTRVVLLSIVLSGLPAAGAAQESDAVHGHNGHNGAASARPLDFSAHRDPFRPFTFDLRREQPEQLSPLQRYELGQLTVVATVWKLRPPRAMVEDSAGMGYIVTLGTPMGPNGGVVTAIEPEQVWVEERVLDYYGKEQVNRIVMQTPREEGPNQAARERK